MITIEKIIECIGNKKSFVLEAGAGSGKTYTLIQTLNYLIESKGKNIKYNNQKIICITYTNVAKNEIIERLEYNPLVLVSTIHEFLWDSIKFYQKQLKIELCKLNEIRYNEEVIKGKSELKYIPNLLERIKKIDEVVYQDTAFRDFEQGILHHDDVIVLSKMMFESNVLLTSILAQKFPFILVDEYQDTAIETVNSLIDFLLERNKEKIILGFYGDSHQKIYDTGIGDLEKYYQPVDINDKKLEIVKKEENYRSSRNVVELLNNFRSNIRQQAMTSIEGSVKFIYCENYPIKETKGTNGRTKDEGIIEYEKRIEPYKNDNYDKVITKLRNEFWNFDAKSNDKILVIANSRVAKRAKFGELYQKFNQRYGQRTKEQLLDRNHTLIKHFLGYVDKKTSQEREIGVENLISFWNSNNYNEVLRFLKKNSNLFENNLFRHIQKKQISNLIDELIEIRETKNVKDVFEYIESKNILRKSDSLYRFLERINSNYDGLDEEIKLKIKKDKDFYESLMSLPYMEIISLFEHTQNNTVFSTKHGTKGEEYRNVLTIIDDTEWKQEYNFQNFFNNSDDNEERKFRTRNLFYVESSRAKENLVVLALSPMDKPALNNIEKWFGTENVISIDEL